MTASWSEKSLRQLRAARCSGDGQALVALLVGQPWGEVLQQVGDTVGDAAAARVPGAGELAAMCIAALGERAWEGDGELTEQLAAATGRGPVPLLTPLPVDLEELSGLLEGDTGFGGGRIDLTTGDCRPQYAESDGLEEGDEDVDRWLLVQCEGSRDGYRDMELFITTIGDVDFANRLEIAIAGRGAFRRFKDVLARREEELRRFHLFAEERQWGRARAWLSARGYRPAPGAAPSWAGPRPDSPTAPA